MRKLVCCWLVLGGFLIGGAAGQDKGTAARPEAARNLRSALQALKDRGASRTTLSRQLADAILSLAQAGHEPSRSAVASFSEELTAALLGKDLTKEQLTAVEQSIGEVLHVTGATSIPASRLRETLTALGVDATMSQTVTRRLIAMGEEVRGPDDMPAK
ncbi:MAG: hypothetical protein ACLQBJ_09635 [Bryobacteraceae bacterium]